MGEIRLGRSYGRFIPAWRNGSLKRHEKGGDLTEGIRVIADFSVTPIGTGDTSMGRYVAEAVKAVRETGVKYKITSMSTVLEAAKLEDVFEAVRKAHEAVFATGAERVITDLRIDDRRDKASTMEYKAQRVEEELRSR